MLGIIVRAGRVLVAWRDGRRHQGGRLEFPGGKIEQGESPEQALRRELMEEIGVAAEVGAPLIRFSHDYGDCRLLIDAREASIVGDPEGADGKIEWRLVETLLPGEFPPANLAILNALKLPRAYAILSGAAPFEQEFEHLLESGVRLILFRAKAIAGERYLQLAGHLCARAREAGVGLLLHDRPEAVAPLMASGVHLSQEGFSVACREKERPVSPGCWFAVSCHTLGEVRRAEAAGVDFCVLGPVKPSPGHAAAIGFDAFEEIVAHAHIPVYALGGMSVGDLGEARARGAQGIAGIRCFAP